MAVKKITVRYLCDLTSLSIDQLSHKLGFHTNYGYRLSKTERDLLTTSKAKEILELLEVHGDTPYTTKTILKKKGE